MNTLSIAVIGSDCLGHSAAAHFVRAGHRVRLVHLHGTNSLHGVGVPDLSAEDTTVADAVRAAEIVLLAVAWKSRFAVILAAGGETAFEGKIVIDAINAHEESPLFDKLGPCASSEAIAGLIGCGARLVKAFNTLDEETLSSRSHRDLPTDERIAIPLCGDDPKATQIVSSLIEEIGFAPVDLGRLVFCHLLEPHRSLHGKAFTLPQVRLELARYQRGQNSN